MSAYLQGLRSRLQNKNILIQTVKPGYIKTKMTEHLPSSLLMSTPTIVARDIVRAIEGKKEIVYTPWYWRWILLIIRNIPEFLFKKLNL